jgi:hypothetical protein
MAKMHADRAALANAKVGRAIRFFHFMFVYLFIYLFYFLYGFMMGSGR